MSDEIIEFIPAEELTEAEQRLKNSDGIKPAWQPLRDEILSRLQNERPDCDTVTLMTMERISFIYTKMKQIEASGASVNDQKEFMKMYNELISLLGKLDKDQEDSDRAMAETMQMVLGSVKDAVSSLPQEQQNAVMSRMLKAVNE